VEQENYIIDIGTIINKDESLSHTWGKKKRKQHRGGGKDREERVWPKGRRRGGEFADGRYGKGGRAAWVAKVKDVVGRGDERERGSLPLSRRSMLI